MWIRVLTVLDSIRPLVFAFSLIGIIWLDRTILLITDEGARHRSPAEGYILSAGVDNFWLELFFSIIAVALLRRKVFSFVSALARSSIALIAVAIFFLALRWLR
jgi:hypothetical protein